MFGKEHQNKKVSRNRTCITQEAVDVHVGRRVRQRRTMLGISQAGLAEALGLTFQQVQKYEHGTNRISAGRLHLISTILGVSIDYFFAGITPASYKTSQNIGPALSPINNDSDPMFKRETLELIRAYYKINDTQVRRRILDLTKQLGKTFDDK